MYSILNKNLTTVWEESSVYFVVRRNDHGVQIIYIALVWLRALLKCQIFQVSINYNI